VDRLPQIIAGSALSLVACSSSSSRPATPEETDDTAQSLGAMVAADGGSGDVASMIDAVQLARGDIPQGFSRTTDGHVHCKRLNLDISYMVTCRNAAGATLPRCDRTTDAADIEVSWSGSIDVPGFSAMTSRTGSWSLSGLQSETTTFDGLSAFSSSTTLMPIFRPDTSASYELDTAAAYDAIKVATASHRPFEGSAQFNVHAHRMRSGTRHDVDTAFEIDAELTFHADHTASLVLDGVHHYVINLDTGRVTRID
jgi:hypothetical protein